MSRVSQRLFDFPPGPFWAPSEVKGCQLTSSQSNLLVLAARPRLFDDGYAGICFNHIPNWYSAPYLVQCFFSFPKARCCPVMNGSNSLPQFLFRDFEKPCLDAVPISFPGEMFIVVWSILFE
jgi:hypothetical protein